MDTISLYNINKNEERKNRLYQEIWIPALQCIYRIQLINNLLGYQIILFIYNNYMIYIIELYFLYKKLYVLYKLIIYFTYINYTFCIKQLYNLYKWIISFVYINYTIYKKQLYDLYNYIISFAYTLLFRTLVNTELV